MEAEAKVTMNGYTEDDIQRLVDELRKAGVTIMTTCDKFVCKMVIDTLEIVWSEPDGMRVYAADSSTTVPLPKDFVVRTITFSDDYPVVTFGPLTPPKRKYSPSYKVNYPKKGGCGG